ncbi:MAG: type I restriction endonuclease [Galbitalea sp.]
MSDLAPRHYEPIAVTSESTVVAEFTPDAVGAAAYQSEAELEREFIQLLQGQAYEYLTIHSEADLLVNLRTQLETLNDVIFSDAEWGRLLGEYIAGANDGAVEKTVRLQENHIHAFKRDDGRRRTLR